MEADFYLIARKPARWCGRPTIRTAKKQPGLNPDEIAIRVHLSLPDSLFTRPQLKASIKIPEGQAPAAISAEVSDNIVEAIRQHTGLAVQLTVEPSPEAA